jgi:hypothetical protein
MKKYILPSLVVALILFIWQFISFAAVNFHSGEQQYTAKQDTIEKFINSLNLEEGSYMIPNVEPNTPSDKLEEEWKKTEGKPWMFVKYHKNRKFEMAMPMFRGFVSDLIAGILLLVVFGYLGSIGLQKSMVVSLCFGLFSFIYIPYTNHIWYPAFDITAYLLDAIVPFAIIGFLNAKWWNK